MLYVEPTVATDLLVERILLLLTPADALPTEYITNIFNLFKSTICYLFYGFRVISDFVAKNKPSRFNL